MSSLLIQKRVKSEKCGTSFLPYLVTGLHRGIPVFRKTSHTRNPRMNNLFSINVLIGLSLCHGANGVPGVVAVLNGIAGFSQSPTQPNHYTIRPELMDLEWANIEFPVKEGKIKLKLSKEGKNQIEIPDGCKVDFINQNKVKKTFTKKGSYRM